MTPHEKIASLPFDLLAAKYAQLRERRAVRKKEYETADAPDETAMEALSRALLSKLHDAGATSIKTNHGTVYLYPKKTAAIIDFDALWQHIVEHDTPELLQRRVSLSEVEAFNELNPTTPVPGLQIEVIQEARLRAK